MRGISLTRNGRKLPGCPCPPAYLPAGPQPARPATIVLEKANSSVCRGTRGKKIVSTKYSILPHGCWFTFRHIAKLYYELVLTNFTAESNMIGRLDQGKGICQIMHTKYHIPKSRTQRAAGKNKLKGAGGVLATASARWGT